MHRKMRHNQWRWSPPQKRFSLHTVSCRYRRKDKCCEGGFHHSFPENIQTDCHLHLAHTACSHSFYPRLVQKIYHYSHHFYIHPNLNNTPAQRLCRGYTRSRSHGQINTEYSTFSLPPPQICLLRKDRQTALQNLKIQIMSFSFVLLSFLSVSETATQNMCKSPPTLSFLHSLFSTKQ